MEEIEQAIQLGNFYVAQYIHFNGGRHLDNGIRDILIQNKANILRACSKLLVIKST